MVAHLARVVDPARISQVDLVVHAVAGSDGRPVLEGDAAADRVRRSLPRVVVLHAAVDVVGIVHVHADRVHLADAQVEKVVGGAAAVADTFTPPSLPIMMRFESSGSHHIVRKSPKTPRKKPFVFEQLHVLPPSVEEYIVSLVTITWSGLFGLILIWLKGTRRLPPATSTLSLLVLRHVLPPSSER